MDESVIVKCEKCGSEALIYARDSDNLERASDDLPINWRMRREQNGDLNYLCPDHHSVEDLENYNGQDALEDEGGRVTKQ